MPSTSIACGTLLVLIGVIGFINAMMTEHTSWTALIPAVIGVILIGLGVVARSRENLRKHLMHAAVAVALLGFIAVTAEVFRKEIVYSASVVSKISTALVCLLFVVLAIKSFADARRRNEEI
jgi:uncharacterized membrane protein